MYVIHYAIKSATYYRPKAFHSCEKWRNFEALLHIKLMRDHKFPTYTCHICCATSLQLTTFSHMSHEPHFTSIAFSLPTFHFHSTV